MKIPIIYDEKDPKWILLCKILKIFDDRETGQELSKEGLIPLKRSVNILKIVMIVLFFDWMFLMLFQSLIGIKSLKSN